MAPMDHIKIFLDGFGSIMDLGDNRGYAVPQRGGFASDARALGGDTAKVARGLNRNMKAYGKPANHR